MKAQIHITGQIGGNFKLLNKISNCYSTTEKGMFNSFYLNFDSIGEAKKAMKKAWQSIKSEDENTNWHDGLNKDFTTLSYDASQAQLTKYYNNEKI